MDNVNNMTIVNDDEDHIMDETTDDQQQPFSFSLHTLPTRRFYLTRRGKILQSTTERYLRDDLGYGTMLVPDTDTYATTMGGKKKKKKKSMDTIAGKITQLVPWTIEDVSSLWGMLVSTTASPSSWYDNDEVGGGGGGTSLNNNKIRLAVVDTNALLHHMDVLEYLRDNSSSSDENDNDGDNNNKQKHYAIANAIVIPQTALEECRHRSLVMYRRATDLVRSSSSSSGDDESGGGGKKKQKKRCVIVFADVHHVDTQIKKSGCASSSSSSANDVDGSPITINDENDARLRKVAYFYGQALYQRNSSSSRQKNTMEVVFLSDDVQSRKLALMEQPQADDGSGLYYKTRSMRGHVTLLQKEDSTLNLLDMVAQFNTAPGTTSAGGSSKEDGTVGHPQNYYPPHIASSTLSHGLQTNRYYQGVYRSNRDSYTEGYVTIRRGEDRAAVVIRGREDVNRAVDGDIVAVELFSV
ncbi:hypothetical protein ACHAXR_004927, partial [Thalassiosira sp. AJA248-18]